MNFAIRIIRRGPLQRAYTCTGTQVQVSKPASNQKYFTYILVLIHASHRPGVRRQEKPLGTTRPPCFFPLSSFFLLCLLVSLYTYLHAFHPPHPPRTSRTTTCETTCKRISHAQQSLEHRDNCLSSYCHVHRHKCFFI